MVHDYFLSKHWDTFVKQDLESFVSDFNQNAAFELNQLPNKASTFIGLITENNVLGSYIDFAGLEQAFNRIDTRLSSRIIAKETTTSYIPNVLDNYAEIEQDFLEFFPLLVSMFLDKSEARTDEHFFKID